MSDSKNNRFQWPIVGHSNIVSYLQQSLLNGRLAQAYLFVGPLQVGKTTIVKSFVNSLVCENLHQGKELVPCGQCQHCRQVTNKIHPDIFWLERIDNEKTGKLKKNIGIEQIRELQNKLSLHSFLDSYKIAVINEAQTLSSEAANSLLKTLEEPTPKTIIILLTTSLASLPQTIVSRCQILKFLPVSSQEIFDYLISLKVERKKAKVLAALAFGRPGLAIDYFNEPENYLTFQDQTKQLITLVKADLTSRFKIVNDLALGNDVNSIKESLSNWQRIFRDLSLIKIGAENLISNLNLQTELKSLAEGYSRDNLLKIMAEITTAKRYLDANVNPKLTLENLILNF
ncbi:MAG: DNA polymerase III subunit delta' [Patescibacteria group bacterium]|jgi:DNA polymerase-3 subunit delta'